MLAGPLAVSSNRHRSLPVLASTPTTPLPTNCTYCLTPAASVTTTDAYPAVSPIGDFQTVSPVFLLRATIVASAPPGVTTTTSPSNSGDSEYAHCPGLPPKSLRRLLVQTAL